MAVKASLTGPLDVLKEVWGYQLEQVCLPNHIFSPYIYKTEHTCSFLFDQLLSISFLFSLCIPLKLFCRCFRFGALKIFKRFRNVLSKKKKTSSRKCTTSTPNRSHPRKKAYTVQGSPHKCTMLAFAWCDVI